MVASTTPIGDFLRGGRIFPLDSEVAEGLAEAAKRKASARYWLPGAAPPSRGSDLGAAIAVGVTLGNQCDLAAGIHFHLAASTALRS